MKKNINKEFLPLNSHTPLSNICYENMQSYQHMVDIIFVVQGLHQIVCYVTVLYNDKIYCILTPLSNIISLNSFILSSSESIFFFSCAGTFLVVWTTATGSSAGGACSS